MDFYASFLVPVAVGSLSGILGAYVSVVRFKGEKRWLMKVDAYNTVIDCLSDMEHRIAYDYRYWQQNKSINDSAYAPNGEKAAEINRIKNRACLILDPAVTEALDDFLLELMDSSFENEQVCDPDDVLIPVQLAVRRALNMVVEASRRDLG